MTCFQICQYLPELGKTLVKIPIHELAARLCTLFDSLEGEETLLPRALVEDMISPESHSEYGLGPRIRDVNGRTAVQHGGSNNSYRAFFRVFPETRAGYVVFTNATEGDELIDELEPILDEFVNGG